MRRKKLNDELTKEHIKQILKRLDDERQKYEKIAMNGERLTAGYIIDYLKDKYDITMYSIPTEPTINKHIYFKNYNEEEPNYSINITLVAQLCRMFGVSLSYILALPDDAEMTLSLDTYGSKFTQLDDPHYFGEFTCYMLQEAKGTSNVTTATKTNTLRKNDTIVKCHLHIYKKANKAMAALTIYYPTDKPDKYRIIQAIGQPIHIKASDNIIVNLASEDGRLYTLMYGHKTFHTSNLLFRECILLSPSPGNPGKPFVSKMVLFHNEVNEKHYELIRGLLSFNVSSVIIAKSKLEQLCIDDDIKKFVEEFKPFLDLYQQPFYVIPDSLIDCNYETTFSQLELKKIMLKLRNHSYSMAQFEIGNDSKVYSLAKELQNYKHDIDAPDPID